MAQTSAERARAWRERQAQRQQAERANLEAIPARIKRLEHTVALTAGLLDRRLDQLDQHLDALSQAVTALTERVDQVLRSSAPKPPPVRPKRTLRLVRNPHPSTERRL